MADYLEPKKESKQKQERNKVKKQLIKEKRDWFDWAITSSVHEKAESPYVHSSVYTFQHVAKKLGILSELGAIKQKIYNRFNEAIKQLSEPTAYAKSIDFAGIVSASKSGQSERFDIMKNAIKGEISKTLYKMYRNNKSIVTEKGQLKMGDGTAQISTYVKNLNKFFQDKFEGSVTLDYSDVMAKLQKTSFSDSRVKIKNNKIFLDGENTKENATFLADTVQEAVFSTIKMRTPEAVKDLFPTDMNETIGMQEMLGAFLYEYKRNFEEFDKKDKATRQNNDAKGNMNNIKTVYDLLYTNQFNKWSIETMQTIEKNIYRNAGYLKELLSAKDLQETGIFDKVQNVGSEYKDYNSTDVGVEIAGYKLGISIKQKLRAEFDSNYSLSYELLEQFMSKETVNQISYFMMNYGFLSASDAAKDRKLKKPDESAYLRKMYKMVQESVSIISATNAILGGMYFDDSKNASNSKMSIEMHPILLQMSDGVFYTYDLLIKLRDKILNGNSDGFGWKQFEGIHAKSSQATKLHNNKLSTLLNETTGPMFTPGTDGRAILQKFTGHLMPKNSGTSMSIKTKLDLTKMNAEWA